MCLIINPIHQNILKCSKPFKAKQNILVYKRLLFRYGIGQYITPFQGSIIHFEHGKCEMTAKMISHRYNEIDEGIHAYISSGPITYGYHNAIIPKGTNFFLGCHTDIVAERMIIYSVWTKPEENAIPVKDYIMKYISKNFIIL